MCEECAFARWVTRGARRGWCHRLPPQRDDAGDGKWPTIDRREWCGEFKKRKD